MRRLLLPLVALLLAGTATFAVRGWLERRDRRGGRRPASRCCARRCWWPRPTCAVGSFVQPDSMRWQDWPDVAVPETYLVRGAGRRDTVRWRRRQAPAHRRSAIVRGQRGQTRRARLSRRGAGAWHARHLGAGRRSRRQRRSDLPRRPGRPHSDPDAQRRRRPGGDRRVSETVLEDLRVIAMGRRLTSGVREEDLPASRHVRPRLRPRPKPPRKSRSWPSWVSSP